MRSRPRSSSPPEPSARSGEINNSLLPVGALQLPAESAVRLAREPDVVVLDGRLELFREPHELVARRTIVDTRTICGRGAALGRAGDDEDTKA